MRRRRRPFAFAPVVAFLVLAGCASAPPSAGRTYINPVLNHAFPDPALLRAPTGHFYAYATQGVWKGNTVNIQVARSSDLVEWEHLGDALPEKPRWAATKQKFWAPHVLYDARLTRYFMYYSAEPGDATGKCLGVAVSAAPSGPFIDSGTPLVCGEGIEHIDPMAFDDPQTGARLLYWGSGKKPLKAQELAADRTRFREGSHARDIAFPEPGTQYRSLIEAAWLHYREGTYYLFHSGDRCCVPPPRYAVMASRSASALGPFETFNVILQASKEWGAPGHNSVVTDDDGNDWIVYHAVPGELAASGATEPRIMLMDPIEYRDGWPRIAGQAPSARPLPGPRLKLH